MKAVKYDAIDLRGYYKQVKIIVCFQAKRKILTYVHTCYLQIHDQFQGLQENHELMMYIYKAAIPPKICKFKGGCKVETR